MPRPCPEPRPRTVEDGFRTPSWRRGGSLDTSGIRGLSGWSSEGRPAAQRRRVPRAGPSGCPGRPVPAPPSASPEHQARSLAAQRRSSRPSDLDPADREVLLLYHLEGCSTAALSQHRTARRRPFASARAALDGPHGRHAGCPGPARAASARRPLPRLAACCVGGRARRLCPRSLPGGCRLLRRRCRRRRWPCSAQGGLRAQALGEGPQRRRPSKLRPRGARRDGLWVCPRGRADPPPASAPPLPPPPQRR